MALSSLELCWQKKKKNPTWRQNSRIQKAILSTRMLESERAVQEASCITFWSLNVPAWRSPELDVQLGVPLQRSADQPREPWQSKAPDSRGSTRASFPSIVLRKAPCPLTAVSSPWVSWCTACGYALWPLALLEVLWLSQMVSPKLSNSQPSALVFGTRACCPVACSEAAA